MKLQKNNKYVKRLAIGLSTTILSASIFTGCVNGEIIEPIPTEIIEPIPTEIIEPIPTEIIEPIPMEELPYDEEVSLLGINNLNDMSDVGIVRILEYRIDEKNKIMFTYFNVNLNDAGGHDVYEFFTDKKVFTMDYDNPKNLSQIYDASRMSPADKSLEGATVLSYYSITYTEKASKLIAEDFKNSKYYEMYTVMNDKNIDWICNGAITYSEFADIYLDIVPKEYRFSANELILDNNKVLVK